MKERIAFVGIIITVFLLACSGCLSGKRENGYEIIGKAKGDVNYPQVNFLNEKDAEKEERINTLIGSNLYGPYRFLSDAEVAASIAYEITYQDENYLSICYHGTYTDQSGSTGDVGYAVTMDLGTQTVVGLEDIIGNEGRYEIVMDIESGAFETEYGMITPDNKYIDVLSAMQNQPIGNPDKSESQYAYFLRDKKVGIIITGLPRYGGNFSVISVNYLWKSETFETSRSEPY